LDVERRKMKTLGAILAGGKSRRFGSDKAQARLGGKALLDHVIDTLLPQVEALVVVGRVWRDYEVIVDHPTGGGGPLFGLCAALHHGAEQGYTQVLTAGCDVLPLPGDLCAQLQGEGAATIEGQRLLGLWPTALAAQLEQHCLNESDHSLSRWSIVCNARSVASTTVFFNLNTQADFERLRAADLLG
jgi:molybdenum cofactor guanylyltransferase